MLGTLDHDGWARLLTLADAHRVLPSLFTPAITDHAPDGVRATLEAAYYRSLTSHFEVAERVGELSRRFDAEGIRWVVVKGPVLAETAYPRVDQRWYSDVDVLVHPSDFRRAVEVLEDGGGTVEERNWSLMAEEERGELAIRFAQGAPVDLHWHLLFDDRQRRAFSLPTAALLDRRRTVGIGSSTVPALSPIDQLVHLLLHGCISGGHLLRWSLDLWFASATVDFDDPGIRSLFASTMRAAGGDLVAGVMADRAARLIGRQLPFASAVPARRDAWRAFVRLVDRARRPERWQGGTGSGRLLLGSTRSTAATSVLALGSAAIVAGRELVSNPDHPWRRRRRETVAPLPPILRDDPTPGAREHYFDRVAAAAERDG